MTEIENTPTREKESLEIWDNAKRAKTLIIVFSILTVLTFLGIISGYLELQMLEKAKQGGFVSQNEANASDLRQGIIGLLQVILYTTSVVVFLNWFRRAYGNLHRLGSTNLRHEESMALWSWFIPILFFFKPYQIMHEIWTETQERIKDFTSGYSSKSGGVIIGFWWALFITSNFIGKYILRTAFKSDTIEQLIEGSKAILISDILEIPEALLVILIVIKLSKMETKLSDEVQKFGGNIVYKK